MKTSVSFFALVRTSLLASSVIGIAGLVPATASVAQEPARQSPPTIQAFTLSLQPGQTQPFRLNLGVDERAEAQYTFILGDEEPTWPETLSLAATIRQGANGKRILEGQITADRCCSSGIYEAKFWISVEGPAVEAPIPNRVAVPIQVTIQEGEQDLCPLWLAWLRWIGTALLLGGLVFYLWSMYRNCYFIQADDLARRLQPQPNADQTGNLQTNLKLRIEAGLDRRQCLAAWWAANPLKIGLPGQTYHQTARLYLYPRVDALSISLERRSELDLQATVKNRPENFQGALFVSARTRKSLEIYGVPDQENRLSGLTRQRESTVSKPRFLPIDRTETLLVSEEQQETSQLTGWRILPSRQPAGR